MGVRTADNVILGVAIVTTVLSILMLSGPILPAFGLLVAGILGIIYSTVGADWIDHCLNTQDSRSTSSERDALATLRQQYARGEIDEREFERRLDTLLESETIEQAASYRNEEPITERSQ